MKVLNNGGMEALILDTIGRILSRKYRDRVAQVFEFIIFYMNKSTVYVNEMA
jgi:hypothetical protein